MTGLPDFGICYFAVKAINEADTESDFSNAAWKDFGAPLPPPLPGATTIQVTWAEATDLYVLPLTNFGPVVQAGNFNVGPDTLEIVWAINRVNNGETWPRIISKAIGTAEQDHVFMVSLDNGRLRFRLKTNGVTSTLYANTQVPLGNSTGRAVYDGSEMRLYLNGQLDGVLTKTGQITQNNWPVAVGAQPDGSNPFQGQITVTVN